MWEHTLIESNELRRESKRWWTIPAAAVLHVGVIFAVMFVSYWHVEAVEAPPTAGRYFEAIPIHIGPPPKLGGGQRHQPKQNHEKPPVVMREIQPKVIQDLADRGLSSAGSEFSPDSDENLPVGEGIAEGIPEGIGKGPFEFGITTSSTVDEPRVITADVTPPVLLRRVEPEYPLVASRARLQGIVIMEAVITKTGDIAQIKTLRADSPIFERAAKDAVLQWKYQPATVQGRPVKVYFTVTVTFRLR